MFYLQQLSLDVKHNECLQNFKQILKNILMKWGSCVILLDVAKTSVLPFKVDVFSDLLWLYSMKFRPEMSHVCPSQTTFLESLSSLLCCSLPLQLIHSCPSLPFSWCSGIKRGKRREAGLLFFCYAVYSVPSHCTVMCGFLFWRITAISEVNLQHILHGQETLRSYMRVLPSFRDK